MKQIILSLCVVFLLAGCGSRPSAVEAPDTAKPEEYRRVYPDPATDP